MAKTGVFDPEWLANELQALPVTGDWVVAFSGGGDSLALLHALTHGGNGGRKVRAIHVHHGLQPEADSWAEDCANKCVAWGVDFKLVCINANSQGGHSPEAHARDLRYAAMKTAMQPGDALLTAHHADDQAETLLLQLLRGAGPAGLASMPTWTAFGKGIHARPLLSLSRAVLRTYLNQIGVDWIEDPSNRDLGPARNYLRHQVLPIIKARWPAIVDTLGRAARLQAESLQLISDLGHEDLHRVSGPQKGVLCVSALNQLSDERLRNVVRVWLKELDLPLPNARRLLTLRQLLRARQDGQARLFWPGAEIRRYRDFLYGFSPLPPHDPKQVIHWDLESPLLLPEISRTMTTDILQCDVGQLKSSKADITIRFRRGGERCRTEAHGPNRSLKSLFQAKGVPPWQRDRIPLLYADETLIEVIDYWICYATDA